jgi:phosphatidylinositol-3-phosphatase
MTRKHFFTLSIVLTALLSAINPASAGKIKHVIVIAMENTDAEQIYGNASAAPYINNELLPVYAHAVNFTDPLDLAAPSEPHYVWMEAGTNAFADHTFADDHAPSAERSTQSGQHLTAQIRATRGAAKISWMTYQQGLGAATGACPIFDSAQNRYAAKHNPFVFFTDVSGIPPARDNAYCAAHHRPYTALRADMAANRVANYVFITPDLCNDMHDNCDFTKGRIRLGDDWLRAELPGIIAWAEGHAGVIFITWDEGANTRTLPFLAIGKGVRKGFAGGAHYEHGSIIKTVETIFGLPVLVAVRQQRDLSALFKAGAYP